MPLDIPLTPAAPAATPADSAAPTAAHAAAPGLAALFGLLLAQTVGQAAPSAAVGTTKAAATVAAQPLVADTKTLTVKSDPTADKPKDKGKTQDTSPWPLTLPVMTNTVLLVPENPTLVTARKTMDAAPTPGGESPSPINPVTPNVIVPTEADVIVPTEGDAGTPVTVASSTPQTPTVPSVPTQSAQEVPPLVADAAQALAPPASVKTAKARAQATALPASDRNPPRPTGSAPILQKTAPVADNQTSDGTGKSAGVSRGNQSAADTRKATPDKPATAPGPTKSAAEGGVTASAPPVPTPTFARAAETSTVAAPAMPPADRTQMLRQVSEGLQTMAARASGSGQRQVTVQLHPKDWGRVNVSVTMTPTRQADGKTTTHVTAHIVADLPAVKAALGTHQAELRHSLKEAGLSLDKLTVTVRPAEGGSQAGLGEGRRESRGGDGSPFSPASGTTAQGGASGGGGSPSPFAAFTQGGWNGQGGQHQAPPINAPAGQPADDTEPGGGPASILTGRVDTRA